MSKYTLHFKYQSRTPLPAYTQPTAYRRPLRHLPNPPAAMDTRLSGRRHRRTRTSTIQNHDRTPQKPLHRRQTRQRKTQAELIEELCYMRAEVAYLKELKALSQKADRKGQSQNRPSTEGATPRSNTCRTSQTCPKAAFTTYHQDPTRPD